MFALEVIPALRVLLVHMFHSAVSETREINEENGKEKAELWQVVQDKS